ncbi:hypothetical protein [Leptothrix discophora]|uniref:N-acetyltransferase domain-containing protein n=1 Tax=Leptothrix discophora TaxID=89 RepID=A0ABT9G7M9_LEPDI|nr:hypothetical protein [Leptothrix discophora]MDP4302494.1 hypothetical protein [Leptothrix discophora]
MAVVAADAHQRIELAALNNACWCQAVCAAHGAGGVIGRDAWLTPHPPPPFHSRLVTIAADLGRDALDARLAELSSTARSPDWTIKDSHAAFDLGPAGWDELFSADWTWREPRPDCAVLAAPVVRLMAPRDRLRWEAGWHGLDSERNAPPELPWRQFPDAVWDDPAHAFLGRLDRHGRIVAGAIANRSPGVVGLSNLFVCSGDPAQAWVELADAAAAAFPGRPLVGYERGEDLHLARAAGFEELAPLRVWRRRQADNLPAPTSPPQALPP